MNAFYDNILSPFVLNLENRSSNNAFCIRDCFYSYGVLGEQVSKIRKALRNVNRFNTKVGLAINEDIETYSSIFALWLEGYSYVPLHPNWPIERCLDICGQVELDLILDSSICSRFDESIVLSTSNLPNTETCFEPVMNVSDEELAYILFTSGSTGKPKGVQLSRKNLASFISAFSKIYSLSSEDRCLQCFDLSFDLSIVSFLSPMVYGACVYVVPSDGAKYIQIGNMIEDHNLTFALMAPSTIKYLRPYFDEIDCSSLRYSLFCGEALPLDITEEWSKCAGNAIVDNVYGPTEDTIWCSTYRFFRDGENKSYNGVLSIGKPMDGCGMEIFDENRIVVDAGELGELCLSGEQLSPGYLKNPLKNEESFFYKEGIRWYRSGDLCYKDSDGDIMYSGRIDHQAKIQGFRVEMGEIEYHAREYLGEANVVCLAYENQQALTEIAMFIEGNFMDTKSLVDYMNTKMPHYMIPKRIIFVPTLPLNGNGKIDKKKLKELL